MTTYFNGMAVSDNWTKSAKESAEKLIKQFEGTRKMMKMAVSGDLMAKMRGLRHR